MKAMLVALPSGAFINLDKEKTVLGRNPDSDVVAPEKFVSRRHCTVVRKSTGFFLEDLESANGTFVNGERIGGAVRLRNNDTICLGRQARAYQFRQYFGFFRRARDFIKKPLHIVLITLGVLLVFGALSYFLVFRNMGRVNVEAALLNLRREHGFSALPSDPEFTAAVAKRVEAVLAEPNFAATLERRKQYRDMIEAILVKNGLPTDFSFIAWAESYYDPQARNLRSGAAGMWQLLPATARAYGLRVDRRVDERLDPAKATQAAALYLKDIVSMLGRDSFLLTLAAYNVGDNALLYSLKQIGDPQNDRNFWYLYRHDLIPGETKEYVLRIVALIIVTEAV